jgi:outer membrane lipoprotein-sorting protein
MNRLMLFLFLVLGALGSHAQKTDAQGYLDSIKAFRADYVQTHELLTTEAQKALLSFYPLDPAYRMVARFEKYADSPWFSMPTSGATP